ncbi:MAG: ECF-type sigma factor [Planctomycetota bacterium]
MATHPTDPDEPEHDARWSHSVYAELHQLAAQKLRGHEAHTLQPTALVHEAFLRLARAGAADVGERRRFFALAGKVMRSVMVDHARQRLAQKRDGGSRLELTTAFAGAGRPTFDVLAVQEAIEKLEGLDPELVRIVDMTLFAGMTASEAADVLGVSSRTVERGWRTARAFLQSRLSD